MAWNTRFRQFVWVVAFAILGASPVYASPVFYHAILDGPSESPANASPGIGSADVTFDGVAHTLAVSFSFSGLTGTTTASHIHCCTALPGAGTAGVATQTPFFVGFPIGVTSGAYSNTFDLMLASSWNPAFITAHGGTPASAEAALGAGLIAGEAYLNIHSTVFGGGEIRGFLAPIPEPETYAMLLAGLGLLGFMARRRRQNAE
jgi:hypothetical protein